MIDCLRRHEEMNRKLPWWRKDYYDCPIETYRGKRIKSFYRLICINIKKPFQWLYWKWRRRFHKSDWSKISFPIIKRIDYQQAAKEFVSVQPMEVPKAQVFYLDYVHSDKKGKTDESK